MEFGKRKGQAVFSGLTNLVFGLIIVGALLGVGIYTMAQLSTQVGNVAGNNSNAQNAVNVVNAQVISIPTWIPILVTIVIIGVVLGALFLALGFLQNRAR